jgi:hypothetical protein
MLSTAFSTCEKGMEAFRDIKRRLFKSCVFICVAPEFLLLPMKGVADVDSQDTPTDCLCFN